MIRIGLKGFASLSKFKRWLVAFLLLIFLSLLLFKDS
jgi:hypothetical protein